MLLDAAEIRVACVVHLGLSDATAFGNVLLAQAGLPAIVAPRDELRAIFASDVAVICDTVAIDRAVAEMFADPARRLRYGATLAADARRRFSPRRSAIRIVDLLCAARFGLERPAPALSDSPI
jgi:glycosyltransferase involved in cell wall biosynthesis